MTKKRPKRIQKSNKSVDKKGEKIEEEIEDQKPGFPDIDFKKNLGCG